MFSNKIVMQYFLIVIITLTFLGCDSSIVEISSPDDNLVVQIKKGQEQQLFLVANFMGNFELKSTPIEIKINNINYGKNVNILDSITRGTVNTVYKWRGVHSQAQNNYNFITIPILEQKSQLPFTLEIRVFNDGLAYRIILPGHGDRLVAYEKIGWKLSNESIVWSHSDTKDYEDPIFPQKADEIAKNTKIVLPVIAELPNENAYLALSEGGVFNYSGHVYKSMGKGLFVADFEDDPDGWIMQDTITTPWRTCIISQDLNGLVNSDIIHNLCPEPNPNLADAKWIRPGQSVWSWWSSGTGDWNQQKEFIDKGSKLGFEYNLIDELWEKWQDGKRDKWMILKDLVAYANKKNIKLWVWKYWSQIEDSKTRKEFFEKLANIGIVGVKIDFMDSDSKSRIDFYTSTLEDAASHKLMINFHGANKPTGESRTFPNEMTREGIFGLEQNKGYDSISASHNAALPFTRLIAGHGDYTPVTFNPEKLKGTTFGHQLATAIVFTSSITHWADHPDLYLTSPTLDVIKTIPTVWDETIVLHGSQIGELAALARRKGDDWYIGVLNGGGEKSFAIDLSFLGDGHFKTVTFSDDLEVSDDIIRQEMVVNNSIQLRFEMHKGGGFVARLKRTDLPLNSVVPIYESNYLTKSIAVTLNSSFPETKIYYTIDGSKPNINSNIYSNQIKITEPIILKTAIIDENIIRCFSETRFYLPKSPIVKTREGIFYKNKNIEILKIENDAQIYFTLDNSEPNENSQVYSKQIDISESSTLKAKYIWTSGYVSKVVEAHFTRREPRQSIAVKNAGYGLDYEVYYGLWNFCPDFNNMTSIKSGKVATFDIAQIQPREDAFGIKFKGYIKVPVEGLYTFYTASNDGSKLFIGNDLIVDNDGSHAVIERHGQIILEAGYHPIKLMYFESAGSQELKVSFKGPGIEKQEISAKILK